MYPIETFCSLSIMHLLVFEFKITFRYMHTSYIYQTSHLNYSKTMTFKFENEVACGGVEP